MLYSIADSVGLKKLGSIDHIRKVSGIPVSLLHIIHDLPIGSIISLMFFHDIRKQVPVPWIIGKGLDRLLTGKRLEAKL